MFGDERQRLAQRPRSARAHRQLGAELRLPTGPMGEQHQLAGHGQGQLAAVVVLDEGQARSIPAVTPADVHTLPSRT